MLKIPPRSSWPKSCQVGLHEEQCPPLKKPIYKRNSSSIWIIHSRISHVKKEVAEGQRRKCEEEKYKESRSVWVSLHSFGNAKLGFLH